MNHSTPTKIRLENFLPPEGVPISFTIASVGTRLGAQLLDVLITYAFIIALVVGLVISGWLPMEAEFMLIILTAFLTRIPYYILSELIWNGRTLGKRIAGIRVINADGRRLTPHQIVARNLMKEIEFLTPLNMLLVVNSLSSIGIALLIVWVLVILIVPLANKRRQRLGDMVASTIVVENPRFVLLPDLTLTAATSNPNTPVFDFQPAHLEIYGRYELQTLENVLRDPAKGSANQLELEKITRNIIRKIGYTDPVKPGQEQAFLNAFYKAQREHLEALRLFGTNRENKFHDGLKVK